MRKKKTVVFLTMLLTALYGMAFPFSGDRAAVKAETAYDYEENGAYAGKSDEVRKRIPVLTGADEEYACEMLSQQGLSYIVK